MGNKMAFTTGKENTVSKWFDFVVGNQKIELKIRSADYEPFKAMQDKAMGAYNQQFLVETKEEELKPYHYYLMQAFACLIQDWKGVDFESFDEHGELKETITNAPCTPENKHKLLYSGDVGLEVWDFVQTKAKEISAELKKKRAEVLGKLQPTTNGSMQTDS